MITEDAFWNDSPPILWGTVAEDDANLDALPERIAPTEGCPHCGYAFEAIDSVGVSPDAVLAALDHDAATAQRLDAWLGTRRQSVRVVRLRCVAGHVSEHERRWSLGELVAWPALLAAVMVATRGLHK